VAFFHLRPSTEPEIPGRQPQSDRRDEWLPSFFHVFKGERLGTVQGRLPFDLIAIALSATVSSSLSVLPIRIYPRDEDKMKGASTLEIDVPLRMYLLFFLFWGLVFFAISEAALFGLGRLRLHRFKEENHPRYELMSGLLQRPRRLIISLLIGNEALNVAISSLTSALFITFWGDWAKWLAIPSVVLVVLLFGEVIPKTLAIRHPEKIVPVIAHPVERFVWIVSPLRWGIQKIVDGFFWIARVEPVPASIPLTEKDFKDLVETSQREGALEEAEKHLIHRVFAFSDQTVRNIMTQQAAVFVLPLSTKFEEAIQKLQENRYSRVPVYRDRADEIVGILYAKDLLREGRKKKGGEAGVLKPFLRAPYFVPLSKKLDDLFKEFRRKRIHLAIVVDEYGKMAGIATLEDLLEELFGEIYDELDLERTGRKDWIRRPKDRGGAKGKEDRSDWMPS
jgi:putative hemolysin